MKKFFMIFAVIFFVIGCSDGKSSKNDSDDKNDSMTVDDDASVADSDKADADIVVTDTDTIKVDTDTNKTDSDIIEVDTDSVEPDTDTDADSEPVEYSVEGFVQKGPFIKDSEIQITELDNNFEMIPSTSFTTKTIDDLGNFTIKRKFSSRYVEIKASGFYYNEVSGEISSTQITNYVFIDLQANNSKISINILTTLARKRIQYLMKHSSSFNEARLQSEREVLEIFGIFGELAATFQEMDVLRSGNSNAMLLAISARLQGENTPGAMSNLAAGIIYDIEQDGELNDDYLKTKISEGGIYISSKLNDIKNNLETHFGSKTTVEIPNFEDYCDDDGDGIINKWEFDLDFATQEKAEKSIAYISEEKNVKVNPATTAIAKTDIGTIVVNGSDTGLSESPIENGEALSVKVTSSSDWQTAVTANVTVEFTVIEGKTENWIVEGSYVVTTVQCDNDDIRNIACGDSSGDQDQVCTDRVWVNSGNCTRTYSCSAIPANSSWNSVPDYTQTWNGTAWDPADTTTAYNTSASTTSCRFKCNTNYTWNSSACVGSTHTYTCAAKPSYTVWNTVPSYSQTWNGSAWSPADTTTTYNISPSTTACRYKCDTGFTWNNSKCVFSCNYNGGKCWSARSTYVQGWGSEANNYCSDRGGRMPTISELRTLIKDCSDNVTGGSCQVTDSCLSQSCYSSESCSSCATQTDGRYSVFGDTGDLWSSQSVTDMSGRAWYVGFYTGVVSHNLTGNKYVRCIR